VNGGTGVLGVLGVLGLRGLPVPDGGGAQVGLMSVGQAGDHRVVHGVRLLGVG
jgi:hypothetical protein